MKPNFFKTPIEEALIPQKFTFTPQILSLIAAKELQDYLKNQTDWSHNFGLTNQKKSPIIGKMFGVLIVKTLENEIGYLAAFSGKLSDKNLFGQFVPPVFDSLAEDSFLSEGMKKISSLSLTIKDLEDLQPQDYERQIIITKKERRNYSIDLQHRLFDHYHFLNQAGEEKSLIAIFKAAGYKNPPAGAGECAAPKLLQYAFQNQLKPLALTEFWWGKSPKSVTWQHGQFYAPCKEKCEPILQHMLRGIF